MQDFLKKMIVKEFCESISLHGYSYLYNSDSITLKVAWTFAIITSIGLGTFFLTNQTKQFLEKEVITTVETSTLPLKVTIFEKLFPKTRA